MKILVVIVTYNGAQWLERCLGSVLASETPADLYIWDNDSTDGSADLAARLCPKAKIVRSAENLGFAEANNHGFRYALDRGYDYVYLLNQDAWLAPDALGTLVAAHRSHPDYAVLSPLQMTDGFEGLDRLFARLLPARCPVKPGMTPEDSFVMPGPTGHLETIDVPRVMAAHWLVPREALERVGVFSDLFPIYGNDDNWCDRARYHGYKVGVVPAARAVHDRAYRQEPKEKVIFRNYYMGSLVRLCNINRPLWERFLFVCLFTLVKAVKYGSTLPFKHFRSLVGMLPQIKKARKESKSSSGAPGCRRSQ